MYLICSPTAWGCQGVHNGLCDSLGWQGGDFAFSASFLILNEIMPPGPVQRRRARVRPPALPLEGGEGSLDGVEPPLLGVARDHHGVGQISGQQLCLLSPGNN